MSDDDLYDEFGNFVGEGTFNREDEQRLTVDEVRPEHEAGYIEEQPSVSTSVVKSDLKRAYGDDVEILVETQDTQEANEPLVKVDSEHLKGPGDSIFTHLVKNIPKTTYDRDYMLGMLQIPERIRNVAVIGPLNSGKTSLVDLLVIESHQSLPHMTAKIKEGWKQLRYMDNSRLEIERGVSMKLNGITMLSTDMDDKSVAINLLDTPGHVNFMEQVAVALAATDCTIICVDVVEGITSPVENLIKQCQKALVEPIFVLNKIDRLILELKLPPLDAYLKIRHVVEQINSFTKNRYSPELNNVIFASAKLGFTFTIEQFVRLHYSSKLSPSQIIELSSRLWGNYSFQNGKLSPSSSAETSSFVQLVLLPIYKLFTHTLSSERSALDDLLSQCFSIKLEPQVLKSDPLPLLKRVLSTVFQNNCGLVQSLSRCSDSLVSSRRKHKKLMNVQLDDLSGPVLAHAVQTVDYGGSEWSLIRVYSGRIEPGTRVRVIDANDAQAYISENPDRELEDLDDYPMATIQEIALLGGRYLFPVNQATSGQLVLVKGISESYLKSATLAVDLHPHIPIFEPLDYINEPVFRIVIEPLQPKELPNLLNGLNKIAKYYPGVVVKVEESGEHVILGFGELYLDSLLYDLRNNYAKIEVKLSNPLTVFSESCAGESFAAIPATSPSGSLSICISAAPMDKNLIKDLVRDKIDDALIQDKKKLAKLLRTEYGWDSLAARNVWTFSGNNVLIDDTLPDETDKDFLNSYKQQITQGFSWAIREGPLAEEPIHGVQFKLLNVGGFRDLGIGGQLIPIVKKACSIALMTATPILLEPIFEVDVIFQSVLLPILEELFKKRRGGRIYRCDKIAGAPLSELRAQLPVIESVGFETDLRLATGGGAMCQLHFWNKIWRKVPGDVMDQDAPIPKLKAAPINSLSRDFVMKTRRRKGISSDGFMSNDGPTLEKFVDPETFKQLSENGLI